MRSSRPAPIPGPETSWSSTPPSSPPCSPPGGAEARTYPIVPDQYDAIRAMLEKAAGECDMVLLNAASSAGRDDYSAAVMTVRFLTVMLPIFIGASRRSYIGRRPSFCSIRCPIRTSFRCGFQKISLLPHALNRYPRAVVRKPNIRFGFVQFLYGLQAWQLGFCCVSRGRMIRWQYLYHCLLPA